MDWFELQCKINPSQPIWYEPECCGFYDAINCCYKMVMLHKQYCHSQHIQLCNALENQTCNTFRKKQHSSYSSNSYTLKIYPNVNYLTGSLSPRSGTIFPQHNEQQQKLFQLPITSTSKKSSKYKLKSKPVPVCLFPSQHLREQLNYTWQNSMKVKTKGT